MNNSILLVRVPDQESVDFRKLRDYILESLSRGVLVLTEDATCEVLELPPLGGIKLEAEGEAPVSSLSEPDVPVPISSEGEEKRAILERLTNYRAAHGLGCLDTVAKATRTRGRITENALRMLLTGDTRLSVDDWRKINRALDRLEQKERDKTDGNSN